jgi:hypothetical protein
MVGQAIPRDVMEQRLAPSCELDKWYTVVLVSLGLCPWMATTHSCMLIPSSGLFLGEPDVTLSSLALYLGVGPLPGLPIAHTLLVRSAPISWFYMESYLGMLWRCHLANLARDIP